MKRLMLALAVLFRGLPEVPVVTFGLEKAKAIYKAARGRYDGDQGKAVPFAIVETAKAMGAEVTLFEEAKAEKLGIASDIKVVEGLAAATKQRNDATIKVLAAKIEAAKEDTRATEAAAESRVALLTKVDEEVDTIVEFFSVK